MVVVVSARLIGYAWSEVAGVTGETDRMTEELEIGTKFCRAGTNSAPECKHRVNERTTEGTGEPDRRRANV